MRDEIGRSIPTDIVEAVEVAGDVGDCRCFDMIIRSDALAVGPWRLYKQRMMLSIASTRQIDINANVREARAHPSICRVSGWSLESWMLDTFVTPSVEDVASATVFFMLIWESCR